MLFLRLKYLNVPALRREWASQDCVFTKEASSAKGFNCDLCAKDKAEERRTIEITVKSILVFMIVPTPFFVDLMPV